MFPELLFAELGAFSQDSDGLGDFAPLLVRDADDGDASDCVEFDDGRFYFDELEKRGLVVRAPGKWDRRAKTVTATAKGGQLLAKAAAAARRAEAEALTGLAAEEITTLKFLLRKAL